MFTGIAKLVFPLIMITAIVFALPMGARAGFLYVLNEVSGAPNQIYGFNVNESTGALTPLAGFPISSGGNGSSLPFFERMGFVVTNRERFPEKVWTDCVICPLKERCDEIAVVLEL